MKIISALAIVATLGMVLPGVAMAQQFVGKNGDVLDGMGGGGNVQNHYRFDGPPNADVTSLITSGSKVRSTARVNSLECDIIGLVYCAKLDTQHNAATSFSSDN